MRVLRLCSALALVSAAAQAPAQPTVQAPDTVPQLLDRYARGDYAVARGDRSERLLSQLRRDGMDWVRAEGPAAEPRRRLIAASLALEGASHRVGTWGTAKELIEWGCELLRRSPARLDGERLWHLASVALAQRLFDTGFLIGARAGPDDRSLVDHVRHSAMRFPDEDRFHLARVLAHEVETWPEPADRARDRRYRPALEDLVRRFEPLLERPGVGGEARVRLGHTHLRLGQPEVALTYLRQPKPPVREPFLAYLAAYFAARAHEAVGDRAAAAESYRQALTVVPRAQSASLALAALLFVGDDRDAAFGVVDEALSKDPAADPWRLYATGDYRFWPAFVQMLRKEIR